MSNETTANVRLPANLAEVPIEEITVPKFRHRALGDLTELKTSILQSGLLHPVSVTPDAVLISGWHRLEACRQLGMPTIAVRVCELTELEAEIAEIDENLVRKELTPLERSIQLARRKALYEKLHPGSGHGSAPGRAGGGKKPRDPGVRSFVREVAERTGRGRSTIAEEVRIGHHLVPEVAQALLGTPFGDNKNQLKALSNLPPDEQRKILGHLTKDASAISHESQDSEAPSTIEWHPAIFDDLPELEAASHGLRKAAKALRTLLNGWEEGPGRDIAPLVSPVEAALEQVRTLRRLIDKEWTPREICPACTPTDENTCESCDGLGWLSLRRRRARKTLA